MFEALSDEKRDLAAEAVSRVDRISKRWERLYPQYAEDLRAEANYGAVRAASSFEAGGSKGTWEQWLKVCINSQATMLLRDTYINRRVLWDQEELEGVIEDRSEVSDMEWTDEMERLLARLTRRQREICELVYLRHMTPTEAGRVMGIRPENACRLHQNAIERLRKLNAA